MKRKYTKFITPTKNIQDKLEECGFDIGPNKVIDVCKIIRITIDNFYQLFYKKEFQSVRDSIFKGETKRYQTELKEYNIYTKLFITGEPLIKKRGGKVQGSMVITPQQIGIVKLKFDSFKKDYEKWALSKRYERRLESQLDNQIKADSYELMRQALISSSDEIVDIAPRIKGDYSYTPKHYLIEFNKSIKPSSQEITHVPTLALPEKSKNPEKEEVIVINPKIKKPVQKKPSIIIED